MNDTLDALAACRTRGLHQRRSARSTIRGLDFFYGKTQALKRRRPRGPGECGHRDHRPVGLRQVDTAARHQPHLRAVSRPARRRARSCIDGRNILDRRYPLSMLRRKVGMVFQKPTPFADDRSARMSPSLCPTTSGCRRPRLADRVEDALRQAALWDEVKDKLDASALSLSGGQQQRLCIARTIAVRPEIILLDEADLGARPDLDREDRGADPRASRALHDRHRHPQHAAGGARVAAHRLLPPRRAGRVRQTRRRSSPIPASSATQDYITGRFG